MSLPQLNNPTFELELPSTGDKVKFRPFLVKEQKILMMAQEGNDNKQMAQAVIDIIRSCCTGLTVDPETLPTFDIEYMFLQLRGKSVGESVELNVTCQDDKETKVPVTINLDEIKVVHTEGHSADIKLNDTIGMTMRYPTMKQIAKVDDKMGAMELSFKIVNDCLVNIYDDKEVYEDMSKKELDEFIEQLNTEQFGKVQEFFTTMPKLKHIVKVTNPNTGVESEIALEGMQSFLV